MRQLLSINQSPIRAPVLAPIHSAFSGNPSGRFLEAVKTTLLAPLPWFKVIFNTETAATPAWYLADTRRFLSKSISLTGFPVSDENGDLSDSQDATTFLPSTSKSGYFAAISADQNVFGLSKYTVLGSSADHFPGSSGMTFDTLNETTAIWHQDGSLEDVPYTWTATELREDEWSYPDGWAPVLAWLAALDFSDTTGIWASPRINHQYNSAIYQMASAAASFGFVTNTSGFVPPPLPAFRGGDNTALGSDCSNQAAIYATYSAIALDAEIYQNSSGVENVPGGANAAIYANSVLSAAGAKTTAGTLEASRGQVKFLFETDYFIFEATAVADGAGVLARYISSGHAAAGDIVDLPITDFASSLPAISNTVFVSNINTLLCFSGQTWADFKANTWPLAVEVAGW